MNKLFPLILAVLVSFILLDNPVAEEAETSENECFASINSSSEDSEEGTFVKNIEECDIPTQAETAQGGWEEAPIAACPRPSKYYSDLLDRLNGIRLQVRDEACKEPQATIERDLKTLISTDRKTFVQYIREGAASEGEQLDPEKVAFVKEYVANVLNTADSIAEDLNLNFASKYLGRNKACFSDDEKESTLSFVGSVVSEVSGALGAVAGPFGAKIALGGEIAGQLMVSVDKLIADNKTYDFSNEDEYKNYLNSFCTYYDFKSELDRELNWFDNEYSLESGNDEIESNRLNETKKDLEDFLTVAYTECPTCKEIINTFDKIENGEIDISGEPAESIDSGDGFEGEGMSAVDPTGVEDPESSVKFSLESSEGEAGDAGPERDTDSDDRFRSKINYSALAGKTPKEINDFIRGAIGEEAYNRGLELFIESDVKRAREAFEPMFENGDPPGLGAGVPVLADPVVEEPKGWLEKRQASQLESEKLAKETLAAIKSHFDNASVYVFPKAITPDPRPVQMAVIQAMQTLKWVEAEIEVREQNRAERAGEFLTEPIKNSMLELESVLAGAIPDFVKHIRKRLKKNIRILKSEGDETLKKLDLQVSSISHSHRGQKIRYVHGPESLKSPSQEEAVFAEAIPLDPNFSLEGVERESTRVIVKAFNELLRRDYNFTSVLERFEYSKDVQDDFKRMRELSYTAMKPLLTAVINDHILVEKSCQFFTNSLFKDSIQVIQSCNLAYDVLAESQDIIYQLLFNSYVGVVNPEELTLAFNDRPNYVPDWIASVRFGIKKDKENLKKILEK